jgi:hypothetical protein
MNATGRMVLCAALLLGVPLVAALAGSDPFDRYRAEHPEVEPVELLEPMLGESLLRTLAVVFHPEAGFRPQDTWWIEETGSLAPQRGLDALVNRLEGLEPDRPDGVIIAFRQACARQDGHSSWIYGGADGLRAFSLTPFDADCRADDELVEASDHEAMRVVGVRLFRPQGRGAFRYGPLRYEVWDDAFAAPSSVAMLTVLESKLRAAPDDPGARNRYAVALYAEGRRDEAIAVLRQAVAATPDWSRPALNLATALRQRGDLEGAAAVARGYLEQRSGHGPSERPAH